MTTNPAMREQVEELREAIASGLRSWARDTPDLSLSSAMIRDAADYILAQPLSLLEAPAAGFADVERVARAMLDAVSNDKRMGWLRYDDTDDSVPWLRTIGLDGEADFEAMARAAIRALKAPGQEGEG